VEDCLDEAPAELGWGGSFVPAVEVSRELPIDEATVPAVAPVPGKPEQIHRSGAECSRSRASHDRAEQAPSFIFESYDVVEMLMG
jgi:hypothetical protein